jgi:hypothetical protein
LIRKIHTYAGLLTFINLIVLALVGLSAALESRPGAGTAPVVFDLPFVVEVNNTDRQVAERVCDLLHLSLATPIQSAVIQHDAQNRLVLDFFHANGRHLVTVLEGDQRIRVAVRRNSVWKYLDTLHTTTGVFRSGDWRMQAWAYFNEFALWSLTGMVASGLAMWVTARGGSRMAQVALAAGCGLFAALYLWMR